MALPIVAAGAVKLLAIPGVKEAALGGAHKIAMNVYSRVFGAKAEIGAEQVGTSIEDLVADIPTRAEIVAAFALLQADLDRRHRHTFFGIAAVIVLQLLLLGMYLL